MCVFESSTATCFVYTTVVLGQPAGLSKEACLYAGAEWLTVFVSRRMARGQLSSAVGEMFREIYLGNAAATVECLT